MPTPFLQGERLYLRALTLADLDGNYLQWLNDAEACDFNSHHVFPYHREQGESFIKQTIGSQTNLVLAVVLKESNLHIGNISLQNIHLINQSAEFAVLLGDTQQWGKGYGKEAAILLLRHGFLELNLRRVYCGTSDQNTGMQKLALALNMQQEGRRREAVFKHGAFIDMIEYGVLREEFLQRFDSAQSLSYNEPFR